MKRHFESGCSKRKRKEKKQLEVNKYRGLMSNYVLNSGIDNQVQGVSVHSETVVTEQDKITNNTSQPNQYNLTFIENVQDIELRMTNISDVDSDMVFDKYKISDPYYWPQKITDSFRELCIQKGPECFQNKNDDFKHSARIHDHKRFFTASMFKRTLPNGEIGHRKWVMYSIKQGSIYCFVCKLFSSNFNSPFVSKGFDKWKKPEKISEHENSIDHRNAFTKWLLRLNSNHSINKVMEQIISTETKYWNDIVIRVISVIKFLTSRGLSLRGDNEVFGVTNNGNFLGILELISEFDPFL
ncbi:zinc finger MYM-type protein 5-like [Acyrthosiphon pisum]|uniref:TTF-type domain-containing protein n=1 Tax=Acyrthosiphon pisum TaxID=7029 RepID=A0A8R1WYC0_ACYPI|nr:zinc finger MYM-type protein 5-like [Acyrthosiphon pisum]|eukprot:XP_008178729.1 PREDICTED: zinc finger MYM-type protein 5-like [Acyrthosiphon pisum]